VRKSSDQFRGNGQSRDVWRRAGVKVGTPAPPSTVPAARKHLIEVFKAPAPEGIDWPAALGLDVMLISKSVSASASQTEPAPMSAKGLKRERIRRYFLFSSILQRAILCLLPKADLL
jgi:hypothetical protein